MLSMTQPVAEQVGAAVRALRSAGGVNQERLAELIGESQSWLSRRELGDLEFVPSEIVRVERALGAPLGTVYSRAGLVSPEMLVRATIAGDGSISEMGRRVLLATYDVLLSGRQFTDSGPHDSDDAPKAD